MRGRNASSRRPRVLVCSSEGEKINSKMRTTGTGLEEAKHDRENQVQRQKGGSLQARGHRPNLSTVNEIADSLRVKEG